jgi:membrane-anchored protein YejM (alkaline phosphatase superfamily)
VAKTQAQTLGKSVVGPLAKFSSVLWLEVTGAFFAIFAAIAGEEVWKWHAAIHLPASSPDARRLYVYVVLLGLFGYFAVSSFLRARRRSRR